MMEVVGCSDVSDVISKQDGEVKLSGQRLYPYCQGFKDPVVESCSSGLYGDLRGVW